MLILYYSIVEDCSQLTVDCFQIRLRIAFSILILIHQQLILPCTYICHHNLTKNLFLKIRSDLQVNDNSKSSAMSSTDKYIFLLRMKPFLSFFLRNLTGIFHSIETLHKILCRNFSSKRQISLFF